MIKRNERGFTIVEMVIVLVIAGILAAVAAPNLADFLKSNARATRVNRMVTALNIARSEAVSRNASVSLCQSGPAAFTACAAPVTGAFENGWIVFTDADADGIVDGGDGDTVLRVFQPDGAGVATLEAEDGGGNALGAISFRSSGFPTGLPANTRFTYCDDRGATAARAVQVSTTGHASISRDTDDNGTHDVGGVDLTCP